MYDAHIPCRFFSQDKEETSIYKTQFEQYVVV